MQNANDPTNVGATISNNESILISGPAELSAFISNTAATSTVCKLMVEYIDIGKRDIFFCVEAGGTSSSGDDFIIKVKVNGETIFGQRLEESTVIADGNDLKFIVPANTSLEVTLESSSGSRTWYIAGYGYYLE